METPLYNYVVAMRYPDEVRSLLQRNLRRNYPEIMRMCQEILEGRAMEENSLCRIILIRTLDEFSETLSPTQQAEFICAYRELELGNKF